MLYPAELWAPAVSTERLRRNEEPAFRLPGGICQAHPERARNGGRDPGDFESTKAQRATVQGRTVARHRCNLRQGKRNEAGSGKRSRSKIGQEAKRLGSSVKASEREEEADEGTGSNEAFEAKRHGKGSVEAKP